jgi:hypothetical protein
MNVDFCEYIESQETRIMLKSCEAIHEDGRVVWLADRPTVLRRSLYVGESARLIVDEEDWTCLKEN